MGDTPVHKPNIEDVGKDIAKLIASDSDLYPDKLSDVHPQSTIIPRVTVRGIEPMPIKKIGNRIESLTNPNDSTNHRDDKLYGTL